MTPTLCVDDINIIYIYIYMIWVNHPQKAELFRLMKYHNLPIYMHVYIYEYNGGVVGVVNQQTFHWTPHRFVSTKTPV